MRDLRHNKGQILKASVDYIRRLKLDADANKEAEAKRRALEQQNRQLHLRIQVCTDAHYRPENMYTSKEEFKNLHLLLQA